MRGRIYDPQFVPYHPRVWRGIDHEPRPNLRSSQWGWILHILLTRGIPVFVPALLEL